MKISRQAEGRDNRREKTEREVVLVELTKKVLQSVASAMDKALDKTETRKIKVYPVSNNQASQLPHPCVRYLVYNRTRWQEKLLHSLDLQYRFDAGNYLEDVCIRYLEDAGFRVIESQRPFFWKKYRISGKQDGAVEYKDRTVVPFEIKSVSPNIFPALKTVEDLKSHNYFRLRMYPDQQNLYSLMNDKTGGLLILITFGKKPRIIPNPVDWDAGELLLKKAEAIEKHIAEESLPDRISFSEMICGSCPFMHICNPAEVFENSEIIFDEDFVSKLDLRGKLKENHSEYERLDKEVKEKAKFILGEDKEEILAGNWRITKGEKQRKKYTVPAKTLVTLSIDKLK